ncbi:MAG: hypothetical protein AB8I08_12845 [Sandaracinaceae bacterium]
MTKNKNEKRRVRARMAKTGESYTAARAQLKRGASEDTTTFAERAGMLDASVLTKTGLDWAGWVKALDAMDAPSKSHREIAATVRAQWPEIGGWWAQSVTVGYERIRGLRAKGQQRTTKLFDANKSKTFPSPVEALYASFSQKRHRQRWLDGLEPVVRSSRVGRSVRFEWPDGTRVIVGFTAKTPSKSTVTIQHRGLPSAAAKDREKAAWTVRLEALRAHLAG